MISLIALIVVLALATVALIWGFRSDRVVLRCNNCFQKVSPPIQAVSVEIFDMNIKLYLCDPCLLNAAIAAEKEAVE